MSLLKHKYLESLGSNRLIRFKKENITEELIKEISETLQAYWDEATEFPEMEMKPRWEKYLWMEEQGAYQCYTARDKGRLVGYVGYIISHTLHYGDDVQVATSDVLYVKPEARLQGIGKSLLMAVEKDLYKQRIAIIQNHVSARKDYSDLLVDMGYHKTDTVYSRKLYDDTILEDTYA
ncbi:MAG: hypothetical protein CL678_08520 [Bdellovibrionaceae bacterium]|nr:hypothetical protein [Pseudobdellovibrionaceae bacterium]